MSEAREKSAICQRGPRGTWGVQIATAKPGVSRPHLKRAMYPESAAFFCLFVCEFFTV